MSTTRLVFEDMKPIWFSNGSLMRYLLVVFALTFGISQPIYAQPSQNEIKHIQYQKSAEVVNKAEYIFEGYFRDVPGEYCRGYYNGDSSALFAITELMVVHCYKGGLKNGTVRLIRPVTYEEHVFGIGLNKPFVFFCNNSIFPVCSDSRNYDNTHSLQLVSEYFSGQFIPGFGFNLNSDNYEIGGLYNVYFRNKSDFHSFLKESSNNISLPALSKKHYQDSLHFVPKPSVPPSSPPDSSQSTGRNNFLLGIMNETIRYSIKNQRINSENGVDYFAFDIFGQVFISGLSLHEAYLNLSFSKTALGVNCQPLTCWEILPGPGFSQTSLLISGSNTPNDTTLEIWAYPPVFPIPALDTFRIATVRLAVNSSMSCCKPSQIAYLLPDMLTNSRYYFTNPSELFQFNVEVEPISPYVLCSEPIVSIASLSPLLVHAGNNEILEIRGSGFGHLPGDVLFKNGDIGGIDSIGVDSDGFLDGLDSVFIKEWQDTLIRVVVPSRVTKGYPIGINFTAGSGPIIVKSRCGDTLRSSQIVNIEYSFINYKADPQNDTFIDKAYIPQRQCINGLVFTLDTSIQNHPKGHLMVGVINTALIQWSNLLGITLTYERNSSGNSPLFTSDINDPDRNIIYLLKGGSPMGTLPNRILIDNFEKKYYKEKINIRIDPTIDWNYSTLYEDIAIGQDFFWAILHEIGHAIGLDHDIDIDNGFKNLMHFNIEKYLLKEERANLTQWSDRAKKGAQDMVTQSKTKVWGIPFFASLANTNSTIVPAPTISPNGSILICCGTENKTLVASHSTESTGWFWFPTSETTSSILTNQCGKYTVRIASSNCVKASLPSLPTILKPKICYTDGEPGPNPPDGDQRMILQPNPANHFVSVFFDGANSFDNYRIQIFTSGGNLIESMNISEDTGSITLYTSYWLPGIYLVVFRNDSGVIDTDELLILH